MEHDRQQHQNEILGHGVISNGMQKRFLVLGGECYYAAGGFNDFIESFDLAFDAVLYCEQTDQIELPLEQWQYDLKETPKKINLEWYQVFDSKTNQIIWSSTKEPLGADERTHNQHEIRICVSCLWSQAACNSYYCVNCEVDSQ